MATRTWLDTFDWFYELCVGRTKEFLAIPSTYCPLLSRGRNCYMKDIKGSVFPCIHREANVITSKLMAFTIIHSPEMKRLLLYISSFLERKKHIVHNVNEYGFAKFLIVENFFSTIERTWHNSYARFTLTIVCSGNCWKSWQTNCKSGSVHGHLSCI